MSWGTSNQTIVHKGPARLSRLPVFATVVLGLGISLGLFFVMRNWDESRFQVTFEREAGLALSVVKQEIENSFDVLRALRAFYQSSEEITRDEFRSFIGDYLKHEGGIQAIEWVPLVRESQRDAVEKAAETEGFPNFQIVEGDDHRALVRASTRPEYFPVYFIEPYQGNETALGFDAGSSPMRREALMLCRDTGILTATPPIVLVQERGNQQGFLIFLPIYRKGSVADSVTSRQANLAGFYSVVFRLEDFFNHILASHRYPRICLYVFDHSLPKDRSLLFFSSFSREDTPVPEMRPEAEVTAGMHLAETYNMAGRQWSLVLAPTPLFAATSRTWVPWITVVVGVLITTLTSIYIAQIQKGAETARQHVKDQSAAREALELEMARRAATEQTLEESEANLRSFFDAIPESLYLLKRDGTIVACNRCFADRYSASALSLVGKSVFDVFPQELVEIRREYIDEVVRTERPQELESQRFGRFIHSHAYPVFNNEGDLDRIAMYGVDITEFKKAQEEIQETNSELRSINRILSVIAGFVDLRAVLEHVLDEALELAQLEGGAIFLLGPNDTLQLTASRAIAEATTEDSCDTSIAIDASLFGGCTRTFKPFFLRSKDEVLGHSPRESLGQDPMQFHAAYPLVLSNECVGVLCVFTRFERRPSEQRLRLLETVTGQIAMAIENARLYEASQSHATELEKVVAERTRDLVVAKERAEAADRIKSAFLATMSHELRTPLNSIIGFTGIILQGLAGPLNPEQTKQLEMVRSSSRHLLALINDVLDISKIEAGQLQVSDERFDLHASLDRVVATVTPLAEKKGLALRTDIGPEVNEAIGDQRRVEQILLNLLNNAIKFTDTGDVTLRAQCVPDFKSPDGTFIGPAVRMSVTDHGIGIKPEDLKTLFQPFRQIESGLSRNYEGTGLGLAICRRLADLMGGDIYAQSTWTKGSTFSFILPLKGSEQS